MPAEFSHEIFVPLPVGEALPLFTPKGEELWVPGWSPRYIEPLSGETCQEMVFATGSGDDYTLWTCLQWQPEQGHVRYWRTTPASRLAFVDVSCRVDGAATIARIAYSWVALSPAGRQWIEAITEQSFAAMIDEWQGLIAGFCEASAA